MTLTAGTHLGRYEIRSKIGQGGMGEVYASNANKDTIWKVGIDGGQPVQLTEKLSFSPAISPDGKQIVCFYLEDQNSPINPPTSGGPTRQDTSTGRTGRHKLILEQRR
jgi:hypothetical protein